MYRNNTGPKAVASMVCPVPCSLGAVRRTAAPREWHTARFSQRYTEILSCFRCSRSDKSCRFDDSQAIRLILIPYGDRSPFISAFAELSVSADSSDWVARPSMLVV